jgi:uncharacterized protein DUF6519
MSVDLSRVTEDPSKHYTRVIFEQGRPHVDADLNEQQQIEEFRNDTEILDVVGQSGAPKDNNGGGFKVSLLPGGSGPDFGISAGRMYADGILAELTPSWMTATVLAATQVQVPHAVVDGIEWATAPGQWVEVDPPGQVFKVGAVDNTGTVLTLAGANLPLNQQVRVRRQTTLLMQPDLPAPLTPAAAGRYLAFLDVWEQEITWIQDPPMREMALGGVDTAGRAKVRAQVRLLSSGQPSGGGNFSADACSKFFVSDWAKSLATNGTAMARVDPGSASQGDCVLPPVAGFRGLESQLYRIQVDKGGDTAKVKPTFKWQRDNGSVATGIETYSSNTATVHDTGRDEVLGFNNNDLVEVSDDTSDLMNTPYAIQQATLVDAANRRITLNTPYPAVDTSRHAKIQRWDGQGNIDPALQWITIEQGLQVQFPGGIYRSGDFWLIPARTATGSDPGTIEWPVDDLGNPLPAAPDGIKHHYAPLGLVDFDGTNFVGVLDCRDLFPPLTDITASDVKIDPGTCNFPPTVTNVQQALAQLCAQIDGVCTYTVVPQAGWEAVFDQIGVGQDARICFPVGVFPLNDRKVVAQKGNLFLEGSGFGTLITSQGEAALIFQGCKSVEVRDMRFTAAKVDTGKVPPVGGLHGALTLIDCPEVIVERVAASCAAQTYRGAACLNVSYTPVAMSPTSARIRDCNLLPGHQQVGLLVTSADRVSIENCVVRADAALPTGQSLLSDVAFRHAIGKTLIQGAFIGKVAKQTAVREMALTSGKLPSMVLQRGIAHGITTAVNVGNLSITFRSPAGLAGAWPQLIESLRPQVATSAQLLKFVKATAQRLMMDSEFRVQNAVFNNWLVGATSKLPATASQGIVVAGSNAVTARVVNNTVINAMEGIHVGLSGGEKANRATMSAGPVLISGNTISVFLSSDATRDRHGIYVGNNASLVIENNYITITKSQTNQLPVDGIRVWGILGRLMVVRQNHVVGANVGVRITPVGKDPTSMRWIVGDNMLEGGLQVPPKVVTAIAGVALNAS